MKYSVENLLTMEDIKKYPICCLCLMREFDISKCC